MKRDTLLVVFSAVAAIKCVVMLAAPAFYLFVFQVQSTALAEMLVRHAGALYGGLGVMAWLVRGAEPSRALEAMMYGLAIANGLAGAILAMLAMSGMVSQVMWISAAVHLAFCLGFLVAANPRGALNLR